MLPSYERAVSFHRFLVKFVAILGIIVLVTGFVLEFGSDVDQFRMVHKLTALFFGPVFTIMLGLGLYMYYYDKIVGKFGKNSPTEIYKIKLLKKETVAFGTMSFYFEKPRNFSFTAGQHLRWTILNPTETDARGNSRPFTIASAPFEKYLLLTTRIRDTAFKRMLGKMAIGEEIQIEGPRGEFTRAGKKTIVMMAGGIGITPFRSMLVQTAHDKTMPEVYLFYSNHTSKDAAFLAELTALAKKEKSFHFVPTMTQLHSRHAEFSSASKDKKIPKRVQDDTWEGEMGYIDEKMIKKYVSEFSEALYYLAGPPAMVLAMKEILLKMNVEAEKIMIDSFTGY